jgi:hypothetical protein
MVLCLYRGVLDKMVDGRGSGAGHAKKVAEPQSVLEANCEDEERTRDLTVRQQEVQAIKQNADRRDDKATARDVVSDKRDRAADLEAFLDPGEVYTGIVQRRAAASDRSHAKDDRVAAADDREQLSKEGSSPTDD